MRHRHGAGLDQRVNAGRARKALANFGNRKPLSTPSENSSQCPLADLAAQPPAFTDEALALRFAEQHADDLRYVAAWSPWLVWDGARWQLDDTLSAYDMAREICRAASAECNNDGIARMLASAKTSAPRIGLSAEQQMKDPARAAWETCGMMKRVHDGEKP